MPCRNASTGIYETASSNQQLRPLLDAWLVEALTHVIKWLPDKFSEVLGQLEYEAALNFISQQEKTDTTKMLYVGGKAFRITKEHLTAKPAKSERDNIVVEEFLKNEKEQIKRRLGVKGRGGSTAEYDLSELGKRFDETYRIIEDAKKIYKNNRNDKRWREFVLKEYPDLPADLLERLSKSPNLSDEIQAKLSNKGGTTAASDIALEYAARLCGVPPYHYSVRHYKEALSKQDMSVKKVKTKGSN